MNTAAEAEFGNQVRRTFTLKNRLGLHARPSALLIKALQPFQSQIMVESRGETANARSILGLLSLAAGTGTRMTFTAVGDDAHDALHAVERLFSNDFGEDRFPAGGADKIVKLPATPGSLRVA